MNNNRFGDTLRRLRKQKNINQKEVALDLNITPQTYSNYECGKRSPSPDMLRRIANLYKVSADYLLSVDPEAMDPVNLLPEDAQESVRFLLELTSDEREKTKIYMDFLKSQRK